MTWSPGASEEAGTRSHLWVCPAVRGSSLGREVAAADVMGLGRGFDGWAYEVVDDILGVCWWATPCRLRGLGPLGEHCALSLQEADDLKQLCLDETGGSFSN